MEIKLKKMFNAIKPAKNILNNLNPPLRLKLNIIQVKLVLKNTHLLDLGV
jgi:hypothetical protein